MSHRHLTFDIDVGEERPFVINAEGKDAVLVWRAEGGAEEGAVGRSRDWG